MRDTSDFINHGPGQDGEYTTNGVLRELFRGGRGFLLGAAELYMLPQTMAAGLTLVTLKAVSSIVGVKPSAVDLEVSVAGIITGLPVRSQDGDIHVSLAGYYLQLPQRMLYADLAWHHIGKALEISTRYGPIIDLLMKTYGG